MRKTFKDYVNHDVKTTFLGVDEFGEPAIINGKPINVVIDGDILKQHNILKEESFAKGGKLAKGELLFYAATPDFNHIPQVDKVMDFNGKKYRIIDVDEDAGMLSITLGRLSG